MQNGGLNSTHYTIVGGAVYVESNSTSVGIMMNYDYLLNIFTDLTSFSYDDMNAMTTTHFEGISAYKSGFTLAATAILQDGAYIGSLVYVPQYANGSFGSASWYAVNPPQSYTVLADSVLDTYILGVSVRDDNVAATDWIANCTNAVFA